MNRKWDCSLQSVLRFSNYFSLNKVWNKLLWFLPTLQFPLCQLHFCLPFSQPFQKISGDQVAEIENEKERMKDRRSKRRKEGRAQKLEKTFCRMQPMGIFSAHWKGPIRLSSQPMAVLWELFPFSLCLQSDSKHHMEMIHVALATALGHDHTSLSLFRDLQKASSCECQQVPTYKANSRCCNDGQMSKCVRQH